MRRRITLILQHGKELFRKPLALTSRYRHPALVRTLQLRLTKH
jgi:hypothetical protein